jgi:hypothetical protein
MENKNCLNCGKALKGRIDKKFCDDYCRNNHNNKLKSEVNNYKRKINNALSKNRRILENLFLENGNSRKIKREILLRLGFQFNYLTNTHINNKGSTYVFCYDYGYLAIDRDWYLIVKAKGT